MMSSWSIGSVLRTTKRTSPPPTGTCVREKRLWWMVRATAGTSPSPGGARRAEPGATETAAARVAAATWRGVSAGRLTDGSPPEEAARPHTEADGGGHRGAGDQAQGQEHGRRRH